jgi:preprotein translocase subunit SecE
MTMADATVTEETKPRGGPLQFFREVREEGRRVTWTTPAELRTSAIMVFIMVAIATLFFFLVDSALRAGIGTLLEIVKP